MQAARGAAGEDCETAGEAGRPHPGSGQVAPLSCSCRVFPLQTGAAGVAGAGPPGGPGLAPPPALVQVCTVYSTVQHPVQFPRLCRAGSAVRRPAAGSHILCYLLY